MQPYFMPYVGYFRLFQTADHFLFLDCTQFPRRGWVQCSKLANPPVEGKWITLPLKKQPREVLIKELEFQENASAIWQERLSQYHWLTSPPDHATLIYEKIRNVVSSTPVAHYLMNTLKTCIDAMQLKCKISKTSVLELPSTRKSQDRIIAAVKAESGTEYINSPSGTEHHDKSDFAERNIILHLLELFTGDTRNILARIYFSTWEQLSAEIISTTSLVAADNIIPHNTHR